MNLYVWASECLKDYASGQVIAAASSVEEARERAMSVFDDWYWDRYPWDNPRDGEDAQKHQEARGEMLNDLAKEPEVLPVTSAVYVQGSA